MSFSSCFLLRGPPRRKRRHLREEIEPLPRRVKLNFSSLKLFLDGFQVRKIGRKNRITGFLIHGPYGCGKTWNLKHDLTILNHKVIEPDLVSLKWKTNISNVLQRRAGIKICVLIRRADGIDGSLCRGWKTFLRKILMITQVPIVITCRVKPFESYVKLCETVQAIKPTRKFISRILRSLSSSSSSIPLSIVDEIAIKANGNIAHAINQLRLISSSSSASIEGVVCQNKVSSVSVFEELNRILLCKDRDPTIMSVCNEVQSSSNEFILGEYFHHAVYSLPTVDLDSAVAISDSISLGDCMNSVLRSTMDYANLGEITRTVSFGIPATIARCCPENLPPPPTDGDRRYFRLKHRIASSHRFTRWGIPKGLQYASIIAKKRRLRRLLLGSVVDGERVLGGRETLEFALQMALYNGIGSSRVLDRFETFDDLEGALCLVGLTKKWKRIPLKTRKAIKQSYETSCLVSRKRKRKSTRKNDISSKRRRLV